MSLRRSSSTTSAGQQPPLPKPSSSVLLLSPLNHILLLTRAQSTSFSLATVFPGGNIDESDGLLPHPSTREYHQDSLTYRRAALRECFEESGILLARDERGALLQLDPSETEEARKQVHAGSIRFEDWVRTKGGSLDVDGLIPWTRWITPVGTAVKKRFSTQMYLYCLPLNGRADRDATALGGGAEKRDSGEVVKYIPSHDGGIEHTAAVFDSPAHWLARAGTGEVVLFPPQYFLLWQLRRIFSHTPGNEAQQLRKQRDAIVEFIANTKGAETCISPRSLGFVKGSGGKGKRAVLGLDHPGREVETQGREGISKWVVLVNFTKEGPRDVEVIERDEALQAIGSEGKVKL